MNLQVKIPTSTGDIILKNPIMPAAATFGNIIEYKDIVDLSKLGALIPNSISIMEGSPTKAKKYYMDEYGFVSSFAANNNTIKYFEENILPHIPYEDTPVFVNIKAVDMDHMEELAAQVAEVKGIRGVEINLNCPYSIPGATPYWRNPDEVEELVRRVKAVGQDKAIIVKVPTAETPIETVAQASVRGGADAFTSFNGIGGCAIDIETRKFRCGAAGGGGYSGPGMKPFGLRHANRASKAVNIPIFGAGGITCARDVLEYIMAGAYAVQVGSANLTVPDFMIRLLYELEELMDKMNINSLDEIRGVATVE